MSLLAVGLICDELKFAFLFCVFFWETCFSFCLVVLDNFNIALSSLLSAGLNCDKSKFKLVLVLSFLLMMCFPLVMVNTPGRSINEKNRRAPGGLFFLPIFLGYIYRLWIKPPWPQFISARLAALKSISEHS